MTNKPLILGVVTALPMAGGQTNGASCVAQVACGARIDRLSRTNA